MLGGRDSAAHMKAQKLVLAALTALIVALLAASGFLWHFWRESQAAQITAQITAQTAQRKLAVRTGRRPASRRSNGGGGRRPHAPARTLHRPGGSAAGIRPDRRTCESPAGARSEVCRRSSASAQHDKSVSGAVFSKDEERVLTWSEDGSARIWSAKDGSALTAPMKHEKSVLGAVFSKDESAC